MAKWKYYDANKGIHAYRWDSEFYRLTDSSDTELVLEYDASIGGTFNETRFPYTIVFNLEDATSFVAEEGPLEGQTLYDGGQITRIKMYSEAGDLQIKVSDFDLPLVAVQSWVLRRGDFEMVFKLLEQENSTHTGSDKGGDTWDEIKTGWGNDKVKAGKGHDYIEDGGGKDVYDGGSGWDILSYREWYYHTNGMKSGIKVDLNKGTIKGPDGKTDKVKSIEEVRGTFLNDEMKGDNKNNLFRGMDGKDEFDGKGGWDTVAYWNDESQGGYLGIKAQMHKGKIKDGFGNTDKVKNIEEVQGTNTDDRFRDSDDDMSYSGGDGDDVFKIYKGDDWMAGNEGSDEFMFFGTKFGHNHVQDFDASEGDTLLVDAAVSAGDITLESEDGGSSTRIRLNSKSSIYLEDVAFGSMSETDFV